MVVTSIMAFVVIRHVWKWSLLATASLIVPFLVIEWVFLGANLLKVLEGGWVPLMFGGSIMFLMLTWRMGTRILADKTRRIEVPLADLMK
uniref:KUP/HAK/KT family potassium transporter n=1 Tax=Proteus mirabilis TaxID=584 RepID=UPI001953DD9A